MIFLKMWCDVTWGCTGVKHLEIEFESEAGLARPLETKIDNSGLHTGTDLGWLAWVQDAAPTRTRRRAADQPEVRLVGVPVFRISKHTNHQCSSSHVQHII